MLEIPEAAALAAQATEALVGRHIVGARAGASAHKFAFYSGDPAGYGALLLGRAVAGARNWGGLLEINLGDLRLVLGDGASPRWVAPGAAVPAKHHLLVDFDDGAHLVCIVAMYGGMHLCPPEPEPDDYYRRRAHEAPSPLGDQFTPAHFAGLVAAAGPSLSAKGLLATEQRIPGLGNGSVQDILLAARVNPRAKVQALSEAQLGALFTATTQVLRSMAAAGGRDTEKDLYGQPGGYRVQLSSKTWQDGCPVCAGPVTRQAYMGGTVYFCPTCQPL